MNFYLRHIGDFNNATRHLTRVERSVYSDAIELYYDTEQPLQCVDMQALERRLLCRTDDEKQALAAVLVEFFVLTDEGYTHTRCDTEIAKYRANTSAKARAGIASAAARQQKTARSQQNSTLVKHTSTNQEPLTVNQKPNTPVAPKGSDIRFEKFWSAYPKKTGKDAARKCFEKRKPDELLLDQMLAAVAQQIASREWQKENGQYIPNPATWLNQGRWQDEDAGVLRIGQEVTFV